LESGRGPQLPEESLEVAPPGAASEPSGHRAGLRLQDPPQKSEIERVEEYEEEMLRSAKLSAGSLALELPHRGELIDMCKKITRRTRHPWIVKVEEWMEWWANLKNPQGTRCIDRLVSSFSFQLACVTIIVSNLIYVAIDANTRMEHHLNNTNSHESKFVQYMFLFLYAVELSLRALSEGRYFLIGDNMKWNWFDIVIIAVSIIGDFFVSQSSISFLRVARLLKVVKVTRMFRLFQQLGLGELQQMVLQVFGCLRVLIWCFGLLAFITYVFAAFFMYSLVDLPRAEEESHLADFEGLFGSMPRTMLTLLQATTGGIDWRDVYDVLNEAGNTVSFCFVLYVLFFVIAVWNIITATFIEKMAKMSKPDNDALAMEERQRNFVVAANLRELLESMDLDSSHTLSHAELKACISSPVLQDFLLAHDVHIYEASTFLEMIFEHGDVDSLNIETLIAYCLRIKGQATSLDLHTMRYELVSGLQRTQALLEALEGQLANLRRRSAAGVEASRSCSSTQLGA
jgi:hypothetical protein